jgi:peptidoglycan/xylan/chitin deacetylase (PgdA/CDA1 family)
MNRLTFDDGNTSDLWAAYILDKFNLQGIFFLNDKPDIEYQVEALLKYDQIVGNHTAHHTNLKGLTDQQIAETILPFNEKLKRLGATGDYFSYPESAGEYSIKSIHDNFKYIYRGYSTIQPEILQGEITRIAITDWVKSKKVSVDQMIAFNRPLQLHGIETGNWFDLTREEFLELCQKLSQ